MTRLRCLRRSLNFFAPYAFVTMVVMAGLDPAIHDFFPCVTKTWMPATSAGMTR